ncbi:MAG: tRNA 2-selenouridine(34) synthase MnmH [Planctomycetes bacterium]|nr:tRNA 2-selenouridine(34) synthase MnmH [Planctomycetota bacterium]
MHDGPLRIPSVDAASVLAQRDAVLLDLRAPAEFEQDHLALARNVPLFDDLQRALIGTLYNKSSPDVAFEEGRRVVHGRVASLVREIAAVSGRRAPEGDLGALVDELTRGGIHAMEQRMTAEPVRELAPGAVILCCHRGGLRSRSVAALLTGLGFADVAVVAGGYKSCRRAVLERLERWSAPPSFVLRGLTGVGKSLVLRELEALRPRWTIDLEDLAQHRSSILGMVGLAPVSQKLFETRLSERIARGFDGVVVLEGESRKVGDVIVGSSVWRALEAGTSLELVAGIERRVDVLLEDYLRHPGSRAELAQQLSFIEQRLGEREWDTALVRMLDSGRERDLVRLLLERYYDPRYRHAEQGRSHAASFDSTVPRECARRIAEWIDQQRRAGS